MSIDLRPFVIAQYKMNDNAANKTVVDSQGFSNGTAQQNTSVLHTTGKVGGALTFNGTSDYVDTNNTFQSVFRDSFSICLWAIVPSSIALKFFFGGATDFQVGPELSIFIDSSDRLVAVYPTPGQFDLIVNNYIYGQWNFIVFKVEKLSPTQIKNSIFINGNEANTLTDSYDMTSFFRLYTDYIGAFHADNIMYNPINGLIDNVIIFSKALSTDEIAFLWNNGNGTEELFGELESGVIMDDLLQPMWSW